MLAAEIFGHHSHFLYCRPACDSCERKFYAATSALAAKPHLRPRPRPEQVQLPHGLRHHELPHWPTEMSIAEIELTRTPFGKGGVERGEARA